MRAKSMLNVLSRVMIVLLLAELGIEPILPLAHAVEPVETGCSYHKNYPCPDLMKEGKKNYSKDNADFNPMQKDSDGNLMGSSLDFCMYLDASDRSCQLTSGMAVAYTAIAAFCWIACADRFLITTAATEIACAWGSMALPASELVSTKVLRNKNEDWINKRGPQLTKQYEAYGIPAATLAAQAGIQAISAARVGWSQSHLAGGDNTYTSCWSAAINTVLAGVRYYNIHAITKSSRTNYDAMCSQHPEECNKTAAGNKKPPAESTRNPIGGSSLASAAPITPEASSKIDDLAKDIEAGLNNGTTAENFATAGFKPNLGPADGRKALQTALKGLNDHGITPAMLARSLAADGVAGTLSKLPGVSEGMKDAFKKLDDAAKQSGGLTSTQFAFEGGGGAHGGSAQKSSSDPFAGMMGNRGPAAGMGGAQAMKFGGFDGDIWHAGTQKSIFEIVRDKTQTVSSRVLD